VRSVFVCELFQQPHDDEFLHQTEVQRTERLRRRFGVPKRRRAEWSNIFRCFIESRDRCHHNHRQLLGGCYGLLRGSLNLRVLHEKKTKTKKTTNARNEKFRVIALSSRCLWHCQVCVSIELPFEIVLHGVMQCVWWMNEPLVLYGSAWSLCRIQIFVLEDWKLVLTRGAVRICEQRHLDLRAF